MPQPPKENPRRRNARVGPMVLPASGRKGRAPRWPLGTATKAERQVWTQLWRTPQAVAWEGLGWFRVVARYVRLLLPVEDGDAPGWQAGEVRQLEDRLGLTPKAMRLLLWTVEEDEEPADLVVVADDRWRNAAAS